MTVVVTAVFHPLEGHIQQLRDALVATIPAVHQEAGCQLYAIHDAADGTITMIEKWDDRESLATHGKGAPVATLAAAVAPFLAQPTTVTTMTPIQAGSTEQGAL